MSNSRRKFIERMTLGVAGLPLITRFSIPTANEQPLLKPAGLHKGDRLGIIAPGGAVFNESIKASFPDKLSNLGLLATYGNTIDLKDGHLAGTDSQRVEDLHRMFRDPEMAGVVAMRGGSGCSRLLPLIDFDFIKANPKPFIGYSDITSLLIAIWVKTGMITYHGPVGYSTWEGFSSEQFKKVLFKGEKAVLKSRENNPEYRLIREGKASGRLIGGNLTALTNMVGSEYLPSTWDNKILFLEEIKEEPYAVDRMLMQLKLAGILDSVKAVVLGQFSKCVPEEPEKSKTLQAVIDGYLKDLSVPSFYGAHIGHIRDKFTVPVGCLASVDAASGTIQLLEQPIA